MASPVRYHRSSDGDVRPCNAKIKACPFGQHWDTREEAEATRRAERFHFEASDSVPFAYTMRLNAVRPLDERDYQDTNLRMMSERSRRLLIAEGHRARAPKGTLSIDLGYGKRLELTRDPVASIYGPSAFYGMKYYSSPEAEPETESVRMFDATSYAALQNELEIMFSKPYETMPENGDPHGIYADNLDKAYAKTLQAVTEMEVMTRGAAEAYRHLGADVFAHDDPKKLHLEANCNTSAFQAYDIVDSLKAHATTDTEAKAVTLHIYDETPKGEGSWALSRMEDGTWWFSWEMGKKNSSLKITETNAADVKRSIEKVFAQGNTPLSMRESQPEFAAQVVAEVEPAIKNYEATVAARKASAGAQDLKPSAEASPSVKRKIFGLFG